MAPGPDPKGVPRRKMYSELALAMLRLAPWLVLSGFKTDGWPIPKVSPGPKCCWSWLLPCCGWRPGWFFIGFQNWRMAPGPDPKGVPGPKMYSELALAMLRLAPWLVLSGFKTDGWPPVPVPKASPGPKCSWSWLLPRRLAPWLVLSGFKKHGWFYRVSKLTDGPLSRSQRPPQALTVVGAGFCHAAAGALAGFIGFQNWRMAPGPDPKGLSPSPKCLCCGPVGGLGTYKCNVSGFINCSSEV